MTTKKNKVGPPTKAAQRKNKMTRQEQQLLDEVLKGNQIIIDNYAAAIKTLAKAASGELKDCSVTNVISSAKVIKTWGDEIMKRSEDQANVSDESSQQPSTPVEVTPVANLISLEVVNSD